MTMTTDLRVVVWPEHRDDRPATYDDMPMLVYEGTPSPGPGTLRLSPAATAALDPWGTPYPARLALHRP
jgi:hypothetical protein